jgi:hypothetical protein
MTNKNKRATTKNVEVTGSSKNAQPKSPSIEGANPALKGFSKAQFNSLLCLAIGSAKIMEFAAAIAEGTENPKTCMQYLEHEETCKHESFASLMLVKYYSAVQVSCLFVSLGWHVWNSDAYFQKLMTTLCFSPLATTLLACFASQDYVHNGRLRYLMLMSGVLMAITIPTTREMIPFLHREQSWTLKSLQSLCLLTLATAVLAEVSKVASYGADFENALLVSDSSFPEPARALVNFWLVDKVSTVFLYAFALVHLPESRQRVRTDIAICWKLCLVYISYLVFLAHPTLAFLDFSLFGRSPQTHRVLLSNSRHGQRVSRF